MWIAYNELKTGVSMRPILIFIEPQYFTLEPGMGHLLSTGDNFESKRSFYRGICSDLLLSVVTFLVIAILF